MNHPSDQPLSGRRFLVTRPPAQAAPFIAQIKELGGEAICLSTIDIAPPPEWKPLDLAVIDLDHYDIAILTSVNGVNALVARMLENNQYFGVLRQLKLVAVGPKTAAALEEYKLRADLIPADHRAEGVVAALLEDGVAGKRILYPRAAAARPFLAEELRKAGAIVDDPIAYQAVVPEHNADEIRRLLDAGGLDAICFSSSSTFLHLEQMLKGDLHSLQKHTAFFSIGPQTSATIRAHGFEVALEPEAWTMDALLTAMVDYYRQR